MRYRPMKGHVCKWVCLIPHSTVVEMDTPQALNWLNGMAARVKHGLNHYTGVANVIRALLQERVAHREEVAALQIKLNPPKIRPLPNKKLTSPEADGQWNVPEPFDITNK